MRAHKLVIVRNGHFVGLFREDGEVLRLWRTIISGYGYQNIIKKEEPVQTYGAGGYLGLSGVWYCNEAYYIPKQYKVHNKAHMNFLASLLGGTYEEVNGRICNATPPEPLVQNQHKEMT